MVESLILSLQQKGVRLRLENERLVCDAPQGVMTPDLVEQLRRYKEEIVALLQQRGATDAFARVPKLAADAEIPLSYSQESLWFLDQLNPGTSTYNIPLRIRISAPIDRAVLQQSLNEVVRRHEALRTRIRATDGFPKQIVGPPREVPLAFVDLSTEPPEARERNLDDCCMRDAAKPFQIDEDLLLRATLIRLEMEKHVLLLTVHHIAADAHSVDLILYDLFIIHRELSGGTPAQLPQLRIQYGDFAAWQRNSVTAEVVERQLTYWKHQMAGSPPFFDFPIDRPRLLAPSHGGAIEAIEIPGGLAGQLKSLSKKANATFFMTLLASFQVLLYRLSGQSDIVVGSAISGRKFLELESVVGLFVNTLPLRVDLGGNPSFLDVLSKVREMVLEAHQNQDVPFETLVKELRPPRVLGRNPLFQVFFSYRNRVGEVPIAGISSEIISNQGAKFDLSLSVEEFSHDLKMEIEYAVDLFRRERILDVLGRYMVLLEAISQAPETGIDDLPLLSARDRERLLAETNDTDVGYDFTRFVDEVIFEGAALSPEREAVRFGEEVLTYRQLSERVEEIALRLDSLGVGPNDVVGLCVERSLDVVSGMLGILRSGAAFVPLDPHYPRDRLAYMLGDADPVAILAQRRTKDAVSAVAVPIICLDDPGGQSRNDSRSSRGSKPPRRPSDLAYVIYTSGSTGVPKGVEICHRSLMNFLCAMQQTPGMTSDDALLAVTTISFDIAILELLLPLFCGGRVVLAGQEQLADGAELVSLLSARGITVMQATPTTWRLLLAARWSGSSGLKILCGGEPWPQDLAEQLLDRCDSLWNMYGPTETTIWSAARRIERGERVLIGRPIANTQFHVLEGNGEPAPRDVPGELHIGGAGVARGYRGRPELTAEKFIANPYGSGRLYKTGDRVRRLANGDIEFLGRQDSQVKIRGFRVELDEIAAVLRSNVGVMDAVVIVHGSEDAEKRLVAYSIKTPQAQLNDEDLRSFLRSKLPHYMVPSSFEFLEQFPRNPSGKIDRKALELRVPSAGDRKPEVLPRTDTERKIAATWSKLLGLKQLGVSDDFFNLGAHSLMVVQAIQELNSSFAFRLGVAQVFENPSVEKLAAIVEAQPHGHRPSPRVIQLQQGGPGVPIYFIYAGPIEVTLARSMGENQTVFGIELPWPIAWRKAVTENQTAHFPRMNEVVDHFVDELWRHIGTGNHVIAGYSFAGLLAFEVARQISAKGGRVDAVILIDKWLSPPSIYQVARENLGECWKDLRATAFRKCAVRSVLIAWWAVEMLAKRLASSVWLRPNEMTAFLDEEGIPLRWRLSSACTPRSSVTTMFNRSIAAESF